MIFLQSKPHDKTLTLPLCILYVEQYFDVKPAVYDTFHIPSRLFNSKRKIKTSRPIQKSRQTRTRNSILRTFFICKQQDRESAGAPHCVDLRSPLPDLKPEFRIFIFQIPDKCRIPDFVSILIKFQRSRKSKLLKFKMLRNA